MTLMTLRAFMVSGLIFAWVSVVSSEAINVTSPGPGFFENVVLDSLLLMDGELQQTLAADIAYLVKTAHFTPQANSWIPKPHPKGRLLNIYNSLNTGNLKDSFTSMVAPVVEMACMSQQYDPMNDSSSKCVSRILKYPIIETIQINYSYIQGKNFDQIVAGLQSTDADRYQNIVRTLADLMNSGYQKATNIPVTKYTNLIKYPLPLVANSAPRHKGGYEDITNSEIQKEKAELNEELDRKRIECTDVKHTKYQREKCDKEKSELRNLMVILNSNPSLYLAKKEERIVKRMAESTRQSTVGTNYSAKKEEEKTVINGPIVNIGGGNALNTGTGEVLTRTGGGGLVGTQGGTIYTPAAGGMINTQTGDFVPAVE